MGKSVTFVGKQKSFKELKKHVATVHCSGSLSLLQRKISNALLYHAYNELLASDVHQITVKRLCQLIAFNSNNYEAIKEAIRGLISTVVEWNMIDELSGEDDWSASSMLASVRIKGPLCSYSYSPRMREMLFSPAIYARINLITQSKFKSNYGLALYENCVRYRSLPSTKWLDLELFRKLMGVSSEKYPIFRDFKRRVLDKAVEEVNTYSDIRIEPEFKKEGRGVGQIRFKIEERAKKIPLGVDLALNISDDPLITKLKEIYHLSLNHAKKIVDEFGSENVKNKIAIIEHSNKIQKNKIQNPAAYLISALKFDYQTNTAAEETNQVMNNNKKKLSPMEVSVLKDNYIRRYLNPIVIKTYKELDVTRQKEIMQEFSAYLAQEKNYLLNMYNKEALVNVFVADEFTNFFRTKFSEFCNSFLTFEDFCNQQ